MARLYMVRRSLETYLGPMTLAELLQHYKRLEFGLQDEVCGSCGSWIALENVSKLKRHYPDVAKAVESEILGGWGVSAQSDTKVFIKSKRHKGLQPSWPFALLSLVFCAGLFFSFFVVKGGRLSGKFASVPDSDDVRKALVDENNQEFQERMRQLLPALLPKAGQSRKVYNEWVPFLRAYAFMNDGAVDGFDARLLRGSETYSAPNDCSLAAWQAVWNDQAPRLSDILDGTLWPSSGGIQILFWDPAWIKRRQKVNGWIFPQSYYEGCLLMALKATSVISNDATANNLKSRLSFILSRVGKATSEPTPPTAATLSALTCFDKSTASPTSCALPASLTAEWRNYFQTVKARSDMALLVKGKAAITDDVSEALNRLLKAVVAKDAISQFNYQAEMDFYSAISASGGSVRDAAKRVQSGYPDVQFGE